MNTDFENFKVTVPSEWLKKPKANYVGGTWIDSSLPFDSFNPATEQKLSLIYAANDRIVSDAVLAGKEAIQNGEWANASLEDRAKIVRKIGDLILEHRETLAVIESLDSGKPISESFNGDILRAAQNFHFFSDFAQKEECLEFQNGKDKHIARREPVGVAALVTPWNLPLYLESWKIAPALMMGNSVVLKPSELTPLTATYLTELIHSAGLPKGVFNLVHGFGERSAGEALVSHKGVDAISFTGETGTGRAIMKSASEGPTRVSFELGGKGASVLFADCDIEKAVEESVRGAFRNQGEICLANSRLYVEKSIYSEFMERFLERVKKIRVGDPLSKETTMGALISRDHYDKVNSYIQKVNSPGKITFGGTRPKDLPRGYFLEPTVVEGLPSQHPVTNEEIFGPLVSIYSFQEEDEVLKAVNQTIYGLSASVWTKDKARMERMAKGVKAGLVWLNCWFVRDLRVPFGGQKRSGVGREGGKHSLDFFSEWKSICYKGEE